MAADVDVDALGARDPKEIDLDAAAVAVAAAAEVDVDAMGAGDPKEFLCNVFGFFFQKSHVSLMRL